MNRALVYYLLATCRVMLLFLKSRDILFHFGFTTTPSFKAIFQFIAFISWGNKMYSCMPN